MGEFLLIAGCAFCFGVGILVLAVVFGGSPRRKGIDE